MGLFFDMDGGWIAVDDAGNYDAELQAEIDAAAQSSGVAQRDLALGIGIPVSGGVRDGSPRSLATPCLLAIPRI